jgi:hypothetical protein
MTANVPCRDKPATAVGLPSLDDCVVDEPGELSRDSLKIDQLPSEESGNKNGRLSDAELVVHQGWRNQFEAGAKTLPQHDEAGGHLHTTVNF